MRALDPMVFAVAPNGARLGKADHPAIPITPSELAYCAAECAEAGAAMIHLHVRDEAQQHVLDGEGYRDAITAIKKEVGEKVVIQVTTEAVGIYKADQQRALVYDVKPEAVSIGLRELLPEGGNEAEFSSFWRWMQGENIWPQIILYDAKDVSRLIDLQTRGIIESERISVLFVLGRYGKQIAEPKELVPFLHSARDQHDWDWSVCAFGYKENACVSAAACMGGHARVGFENNRVLADGSISKNNAALVEQAVNTAALVGRRPLTGFELRNAQYLK